MSCAARETKPFRETLAADSDEGSEGEGGQSSNPPPPPGGGDALCRDYLIYMVVTHVPRLRAIPVVNEGAGRSRPGLRVDAAPSGGWSGCSIFAVSTQTPRCPTCPPPPVYVRQAAVGCAPTSQGGSMPHSLLLPPQHRRVSV